MNHLETSRARVRRERIEDKRAGVLVIRGSQRGPTQGGERLLFAGIAYQSVSVATAGAVIDAADQPLGAEPLVGVETIKDVRVLGRLRAFPPVMAHDHRQRSGVVFPPAQATRRPRRG